MRVGIAVFAFLILALTVMPPPSSAKVPYYADIYADETGQYVASIESEEDRTALISALFDVGNVELPIDAKPGRWDYRIVMSFNPERRYPTTAYYLAPRDGASGIVYWPDEVMVRQPFLVQSPSFDELAAVYDLGPSLPTTGSTVPGDTEGVGPLAPVALGAMTITLTAALLLRWMRGRRPRRQG